jgi:hypothetical protein
MFSTSTFTSNDLPALIAISVLIILVVAVTSYAVRLESNCAPLDSPTRLSILTKSGPANGVSIVGSPHTASDNLNIHPFDLRQRIQQSPNLYTPLDPRHIMIIISSFTPSHFYHHRVQQIFPNGLAVPDALKTTVLIALAYCRRILFPPPSRDLPFDVDAC